MVLGSRDGGGLGNLMQTELEQDRRRLGPKVPGCWTGAQNPECAWYCEKRSSNMRGAL